MLRWPSQNWRVFKNSTFSCKVLRTYIATHFLLVKIFPSVPCIHYKLMKLNRHLFSNFLELMMVANLGKILRYPVPKMEWWVTLLPLGKPRAVGKMPSKCCGWCWWFKCLCDWISRDNWWMNKNIIQPNITWNVGTKQTLLH